MCGQNNCVRVFLNWVPLDVVRVTMQISCNTFEAFVVTLSRNGQATATVKSSRSWAWYTTRATAARYFVASSALTSRRSLRFPPFPQWHTVAWRYFDSSPFPTPRKFQNLLHVSRCSRFFPSAAPLEFAPPFSESMCKHGKCMAAVFPIRGDSYHPVPFSTKP